IVTVIGTLVDVAPERIVAETPAPLKFTAVTPVSAVPVIVAGNDVPGSPEDGTIPRITGGAGFTVKPLKALEVTPAAVTETVRASVVAVDEIVIVILTVLVVAL